MREYGSFDEYCRKKTEATDNMRLVRWKIRRFLEELAREFSPEIGETGISVQALAMANPKPPSAAKVSAET